ncbi:MAG: prepilin-type N-terminal cleavage/methylation domain-containing protein [Candidatus Falkowbacteria bacterium]|nr:prepilin-type N-terminal cleavage/methylation domain-containing protein [Candidatus Falkowbacteria bacterium]
MKNNKPGFTLIELLVVIAIIGLLSTLSILALNSARARARDAKRIADVKQIQTALEMYYNDTSDYPIDASIKPGLPIFSLNGTFLRQIPAPPLPIDGTGCPAADAYTYARFGSAQGGTATYTIQYCLGAAINTVTGNVPQTATQAGIQ